ncbi:MAG: hypothetical protein ACI4BD_04370 [Paludibacteraceae bacterium]
MKTRHIFLPLLFACCTPALLHAEDEIVAKDTITLNLPEVLTEPDPNQGLYTVTFKGTDHAGSAWKVQLRYTAESMCGEFTDSDFYNLDGTQGQGCYNYLRAQDNDMYFFPFGHVQATITQTSGEIRFEVNALYEKFTNRWSRVLVHAVLPTPAPKDTVEMDMGIVSEIPNGFYQCTLLEAANTDYLLTFGVSGTEPLHVGTYYMADLIRPELVRLADNDTIVAASAEMEVTNREDGSLNLLLNMRSNQDTLYCLSMQTGTLPITDTVEVECLRGQLFDQTEIYNMYQFYGESDRYTVALAVLPGVVTGAMQTIPADSILTAYSAVVRLQDTATIRVAAAQAQIVESTLEGKKDLKAELKGTNGVQYNVTIPLGYSLLPETRDTVFIDFGEGVGRIDYSRGLGLLGLVLVDDGDIDVHVAAYNNLRLSGTIYSDYFDYEGCYLTTYIAEGSTRFTDIKLAQMTLDSIGDTLHITLDAIAANDTLYHFTAYMPPKYALTGQDITYDISCDNGVNMIALTGDSLIYTMQFQRADQWTEDYEPLGDVELWTFRLAQDVKNAIAGVYSFSEGTLDAAQRFVLIEGGTEIYLSPVAGTLTITAQETAVVEWGSTTYRTHLYGVSAEVVAANGLTYHLSGDNYLLCLNAETGEVVELSEGLAQAVANAWAAKGYRVRKILRDGEVLLELTTELTSEKTTEKTPSRLLNLQGIQR